MFPRFETSEFERKVDVQNKILVLYYIIVLILKNVSFKTQKKCTEFEK